MWLHGMVVTFFLHMVRGVPGLLDVAGGRTKAICARTRRARCARARAFARDARESFRRGPPALVLSVFLVCLSAS